jgi:ABC-type phosphate/phosphonate transport system substrate-binding protein
MYPFDSVAWAWDALWGGVHRRAPWTPSTLTRSGDVHAGWSDPDWIVTHVCGLPYAARHRDRLEVLGAFALSIPDATPDARYRSVLLSPHDRTVSELTSSETHAVANSADSLSGWASLLNATVGPTGVWPGSVTFTSAHYQSVRMLAEGQADLAAIDAWSLALIRQEQPDLLDRLFQVGHGPLVPTPAITARATLGDERIKELREAFADALAEPELDEAKSALHITGFVRLTLSDYLATLDLSARPQSNDPQPTDM